MQATGATRKTLSESSFLIERCTIHPNLNRVDGHDGNTTHLEPKAMQLLVFMAERADEVLHRDLLLHSVWGDAFVCDQVLTNAISQIRQSFGEAGRDYVQTIPKKGYRLTARVLPDSPPLPRTQESPPVPEPRYMDAGRKRRNSRIGLIVLLCVAMFVIAFKIYMGRSKPLIAHSEEATPIAVAVLPFQNLGTSEDKDYLRFALSDRVAASLMSVPNLVVRPTAMTHKYAPGTLNPQLAGRELHVSRVVTGEFLYEGDSIRITVELVDVTQNRAIWRSSVIAPAHGDLELDRQITSLVREQLLSAMHVTAKP